MSDVNEVTDLMVDQYRLERRNEINSDPSERDKLEAKYGQVWNTAELSTEFEVRTFAAPYVIVKHKIDGKIGTLEFQHSPRFYFNYQEDKVGAL